MSRGIGSVQQGVLRIVEEQPDGVAADEIAQRLFRRAPSAAQLESVRRAIRTLQSRGLVDRVRRWDTRPRRSLKRFVDLAPCEGGFCSLCAQRKRRVRVQEHHRRAMRASAKHDAEWLDDLALADASGFVHLTASEERIVDEKPKTVDMCLRPVQFVIPVSAAGQPRP